MRRIASSPSMPGMLTSISTTSGASSSVRAMASLPFSASATSETPGHRVDHPAHALAHQHVIVGQQHADQAVGWLDRLRSGAFGTNTRTLVPQPGAGVDLDVRADQRRPLADAAQPEAAVAGRRLAAPDSKPRPSSSISSRTERSPYASTTRARARLGVLADVRERLLRDPEHGRLDLGRERSGFALDRALALLDGAALLQRARPRRPAPRPAIAAPAGPGAAARWRGGPPRRRGGARSRACPISPTTRDGSSSGALLDRVKLHRDGDQALGQAVVDLAGQAVALVAGGKLAGALHQPGVLDGDGDLVGQRLDERHLVLGEDVGLVALDAEHAQHPPADLERHVKLGAGHHARRPGRSAGWCWCR